jgi:hypothetical protein
MKSRWITYKGKQILFMDFSGFGLDAEGLMTEIREVNQIILQRPRRSVLGLSDLRGTAISADIARIFEKNGALIKNFFKKQAVVGMSSGVRALIFHIISDVVGVHGGLFENMEQAKDWLADA